MDNGSKTVVSIVGQDKSRILKKGLFIVILMIIIIAVVFLIAHAHKNKPKTISNSPTVSSACTSPAAGTMLQNAVASFNPSSLTQLKNSVDSIEKLPNYQNDPNCLYVLAMYNVYTSNLTSAQNYLNQFNKLYTGQKLNTYIVGFGGASSLRGYVSALSADEQAISRRFIGLSHKVNSK